MSPTVSEQKEALRKQFLSKRKALNSNEVYSKSRFISSSLINTSSYNKAKVIHCYVSISRQHEVETRNLIQHMMKHGKEVVVPKMKRSGKLSHFRIDSLDQLTENKWGVAEPRGDKVNLVRPDRIDMVIVPMVSGDMHKNRLGYGKGYYDRFLEGVNAVKAGILFDVQLYQNELPTDTFDVKLDFLITESKIVT
jgi:5-formyltetrahydrofolate cyclo-ligase